MNSETMEEAEECAKEAGAIVKCSRCRGHYIQTYNKGAILNAYNRAWRKWKSRSTRGFRGTWDDARDAVKSVLEDAGSCPLRSS